MKNFGSAKGLSNRANAPPLLIVVPPDCQICPSNLLIGKSPSQWGNEAERLTLLIPEVREVVQRLSRTAGRGAAMCEASAMWL